MQVLEKMPAFFLISFTFCLDTKKIQQNQDCSNSENEETGME